MSLSGNLGFVPIDEVLRLLTRSHQQGSVEVTGRALRGRVFVGKGGIDLATTFDDGELHGHLVNSMYADEKTLNRVTSGETTLASITEKNDALVELLREMTVESLYQIADRGEEFQVHERVTSPYASPRSFELEALIRDSDERRRQWSAVSEVIPALDSPIRFRRDLGEREEVTVKVDDWKVLSEIGTGSSVEQIAELLGTTDFWTARVAARLVENDLVTLGSTERPPAEVHDERVDEEPGHTVEEYDPYDEPPAPALREGPVFDDPATEEAQSDESWWQESGDELSDEDTDSRTPEVVSDDLSEMPSVDSSEEDDEEDVEEDVEEDTEAFLEKVFSELESARPAEGSEDDSEEGHGLLRRRRMGTLRDFSSDS